MGTTPPTRNYRSNWPRWSEIADFQSIFVRSASASPCKKVQLTLIGSPLRAYQCLRWTSYVAPKQPKGGSKTQNCRFPCKITLCWKKVCYKLLCVKTVSEKVVRHSFSYLFYLCINNFWGRPILRENLANTDPPLAKCWFSINFRS